MVVLKFLLCTVVVLGLSELAFGFRRVCYYDGTAAERSGLNAYTPDMTDPFLCTHIVFSYVVVRNNNSAYELYSPGSSDVQNYGLLTNLTMANPELKTLIMLKEENEGDLEAMTSNSKNQTAFISTIIPFLKTYNFDGFVLEWEGSSSGFKAMSTELRQAFDLDGTGLMLVCNLFGPTIDDFNTKYDLNTVKETVMNYDFITLQTYGLIEDYSSVAHHSRRVARSDATGASYFLNLKATADYFSFLGIPKSNMDIGIATSGYGFTLANISSSGIGSPTTGPANATNATQSSGIRGYFEVCKSIEDGSGTSSRDEDAPYLLKDSTWIGYDDVESIEEKAKWIVEEGYGGAAIYTLGDDDFNQDCTSSEVPFPLISTVKDVFEEATAPKEYRRVCYFTTWAELRTGAGKFTADDIDPSLCTHIIVAFAEISDECKLEVSDVNDTLIYERVIALKTNNTDLKVLLSVGGWVQASESFSYMVSGPKRRRAFVSSSIDFLRSYGFDGLDIAWLYPTQRQGAAETDKKNFGILVDLLRRTYEEEARNNSIPCLLLTAAVAAEQEYIDYAYDVKALAKNLDFLSIQTFDMHGYWDMTTSHHSQLKAFPWETGTEGNLNMIWSGKYWQMLGVDKDKINIGIATYGRGFELSWSNENGFGAWADGPNQPGSFTDEEGFLAYYEICPLVESGDGMVVRQSGVPYYTNDTLWIGYDDEMSVANKMQWLVKEGYGGAMVWSLDLDDFQQTCGSATKSPLLTAIKDTLTGFTNGSLTTRVTEETTFESTTMSSTTTPGPHIDCSMKPLDGPYENPRNSRTFYKCSHGTAFLYWCPADLVFDSTLMVCDYNTR
ncbi:acidic mammalian chitinase-like [Mizuhopecten yessoensis]|uniref:acidic mammalian chitinase-like n=1 Tax=Mizuhopecten yessoensis TaxID=6573 RepID=UPI000B45BB36|nr:acidic mammalian chitinase-like [Mizuhopecten yessoensis]